MANDQAWRITFNAQPIIVQASTEKRAIELAIEYLRQPETSRIHVEAGNEKEAH